MANVWIPSASDALFVGGFSSATGFSGWSGIHRAFSAASPYRIDAQWGMKPLTDEVLYLQQLLAAGALVVKIRNESGSQLDAGTLVYVTGYNASEQYFLVSKADADSPASAAHLVIDTDLPNSTNSLAYPFRDVTGLDTSSASAVGDDVYLSATAGEWTVTAPTGADQITQRVGTVTAKHASTGAIRFFPGAHLVDAVGTSFFQNNSVTAAKVAKAESFAWSGNHTHSGTVGFSGAIRTWDKVHIADATTPSQITGDQDDYNPSGLDTSAVLRLSSDAERTITGLQGGEEGRLVILHNVGAEDIILADENASSSAANRFALTGDLTLSTDGVAILQYDGTSLRWRAVSGGGGGVSGFSGASGYSGAIGPSGASGTSGTSGYSGTAFAGGGTANFVPKWTGSDSQSISVYADDGTYGIFLENGASAISEDTTIIRWRESSAPDEFKNASTFGSDVFFRAQSAGTSSGGDGADIVWIPGTGDGSGSGGTVQVRDAAASKYVSIEHDATDGWIKTSSGKLYLDGQSGVRIWETGIGSDYLDIGHNGTNAVIETSSGSPFLIGAETNTYFGFSGVAANTYIRLDASNLSYPATRTITMPDQDVDLTPGTGTFVAGSTGTASFVPKWTGSNQTDSVYGDDGTYGLLLENGASAITEDSTVLRWRETTVPAGFSASAGDGKDVWFRAQSAADGGNGDGGGLYFVPGELDGAGSSGEIRFYSQGANAYTTVGHNAASGWVAVSDGSPYIVSTDAYINLTGTSAKNIRVYTGSISATTNRVLTMPDQDIDLTPGTGSFYGPGATDVAVADGGTGRSSHTAYAVICGGTTSTAAQQSVASVGTSGYVLTSQGAGALPTWTASVSGFSGYSGAAGAGGSMGPIVLLPTAGEAPSSNYATLDSRNGHPVLDFDGSTDEEMVWTHVLPASYGGGGLTVKVFCAFTSATSGSVRWQAGIERINASGLDIDSDSFASFQSAGGSAPGTSGQVIAVSVAFTDGAQMDSLAAGELFRLKVRRDSDGTSGTDDITTDAELLAVEITETS